MEGATYCTPHQMIPSAPPGVIQESTQEATEETVQGMAEEAAEGAMPGAA